MSDFDTLTTIIDGYADKIDRLERYIQVIAKKTNIDLDAIHAL